MCIRDSTVGDTAGESRHDGATEGKDKNAADTCRDRAGVGNAAGEGDTRSEEFDSIGASGDVARAVELDAADDYPGIAELAVEGAVDEADSGRADGAFIDDGAGDGFIADAITADRAAIGDPARRNGSTASERRRCAAADEQRDDRTRRQKEPYSAPADTNSGPRHEHAANPKPDAYAPRSHGKRVFFGRQRGTGKKRLGMGF